MRAVAFIFIVLLCSCKKKEAQANVPVPPAEVPVGNTSGYDALFSSVKLYTKGANGYVPAGNQTMAYYSSRLVTDEVYSVADLQNIGGVLLNSVIFKTKSSLANYYYNDTTGTVFASPHNWKILGSSAVDSFSYVNTNPAPEFPLYTALPDSMRISSGVSIRLKGTTGCDLVRVLISSGTQVAAKLVAGSDSLAVFVPADLQGLPVTNSGYLSIQLYKDNYRLVKGKKVNFRTGIGYQLSAFKIKP